jgi:hypothetical protein
MEDFYSASEVPPDSAWSRAGVGARRISAAVFLAPVVNYSPVEISRGFVGLGAAGAWGGCLISGARNVSHIVRDIPHAHATPRRTRAPDRAI